MPVAPNKVEDSPVEGMTRFTYTCMLCDKPCEIDVPKDKAEIWLGSAPPFVQNLFPEMSVSEREVLISGSHGKCFDDAFKEPDETGDFDRSNYADEDLDPYGYYEDRDDTGRAERAEELEGD